MTAIYNDEANGVTVTLREPHGDHIEMRPVLALGLNPMILIEFEEGETSAGTKVNIDATGPSARQELGSVLQGIATYLLNPNMVEHRITDTEGTTNEGE